MLYKVTPMMTPPVKEKRQAKNADPDAPKEPRKRRKSAVYDAEGNEVLITMMCLKCRSMKPLTMFGLRKMADGAIRNQPWCRTCRSGASSGKKKTPEQAEAAGAEVPPAVQVVAPPGPSVPESSPEAGAAPEATEPAPA
ncbi:MAG: hypothetical protein AMXMBFR34_44800 [Myxococcaceae bacterium]